MSNPNEKRSKIAVIAMICLNALLIAGIGVMIWLCINIMNGSEDGPQIFTYQPPTTEPTEAVTEVTEEPTEPETVPPTTEILLEPTHQVSTATVGATGDVLLTMPIINAAEQEDGTYNFDPLYWYLSEYTYFTDYAVTSLETTLAGTNNGYKYDGFRSFNAPDEIVDAMKNAGFDMVLTANEHCYDTSRVGLVRTLETIQERGLEPLGTVADAGAPLYSVVDVGGIPIGMMSYTYETPRPDAGHAEGTYLNGSMVYKEDEGRIASFLPENPEPFYAEIQRNLAEMQAMGAAANMLFLHWGDAFSLKTNDTQKQIAQRLCDLGVDVIIGTHPHVVQPIEIYTSTVDPTHHTVCLYSLGNSVSNQRVGTVKQLTTAHTEDGLWFTVTFALYSDGKAYVDNVEALPTWMDLNAALRRMYHILPLDINRQGEWQTMFSLNEDDMKAVNESYKRTNKILGNSLASAQEALEIIRAERNAAYVADWLS